MRLQQRQARETGICPVRRELYTQCFGNDPFRRENPFDFLIFFFFFPFKLSDELIRQVTINCAERGLLLLRVRDEIRMTVAAYQTLYESSIAFGMRKALQVTRNSELKSFSWLGFNFFLGGTRESRFRGKSRNASRRKSRSRKAGGRPQGESGTSRTTLQRAQAGRRKKAQRRNTVFEKDESTA